MTKTNSHAPISMIIERLQQQGVDGDTISVLINFMARDRWNAVRDAERVLSSKYTTTPLGFVSELNDLRDRIHALNAAMIGLRHIVGNHNAIDGVAQLVVDLSWNAVRIDKLYSDMVAELRILEQPPD